MGADKLLLPVPPQGIPLVRHAAQQLLPLAARVIIVANDHDVCAALHDLGQEDGRCSEEKTRAHLDVNCLPDDAPGNGPLGGLATGLRRIEGWALTVAGDMPFLSAAAFRYLIDSSDSGCDAIVPVLDGQAQPLHALYHSRCLPAVKNALASGSRRMDSFWPELRVRLLSADPLRALDPELLTFTNVNTPADWEKALALLSPG